MIHIIHYSSYVTLSSTSLATQQGNSFIDYSKDESPSYQRKLACTTSDCRPPLCHVVQYIWLCSGISMTVLVDGVLGEINSI